MINANPIVSKYYITTPKKPGMQPACLSDEAVQCNLTYNNISLTAKAEADGEVYNTNYDNLGALGNGRPEHWGDAYNLGYQYGPTADFTLQLGSLSMNWSDFKDGITSFHINGNGSIESSFANNWTHEGNYIYFENYVRNEFSEGSGYDTRTRFVTPVLAFKKENFAYQYMWNKSFDKKGEIDSETSGYLTSSGVLVLPNEGFIKGKYEKNTARISKQFINIYRNEKTGTYLKSVEGRLKVIGQIHTHPNIQPLGDYEVGPDRDIQSIIKVPVYIIRTNGFFNLKLENLGSKKEFFNGVKTLFN